MQSLEDKLFSLKIKIEGLSECELESKLTQAVSTSFNKTLDVLKTKFGISENLKISGEEIERRTEAKRMSIMSKRGSIAPPLSLSRNDSEFIRSEIDTPLNNGSSPVSTFRDLANSSKSQPKNPQNGKNTRASLFSPQTQPIKFKRNSIKR